MCLFAYKCCGVAFPSDVLLTLDPNTCKKHAACVVERLSESINHALKILIDVLSHRAAKTAGNSNVYKK